MCTLFSLSHAASSSWCFRRRMKTGKEERSPGHGVVDAAQCRSTSSQQVLTRRKTVGLERKKWRSRTWIYLGRRDGADAGVHFVTNGVGDGCLHIRKALREFVPSHSEEVPVGEEHGSSVGSEHVQGGGGMGGRGCSQRCMPPPRPWPWQEEVEEATVHCWYCRQRTWQ